MNTKMRILGAAALLPAAILALTSCSTQPKLDSAILTEVQPGVPGGVLFQTYKVTVTVAGVDKAARQVTLVAKNGIEETVKVGPQVVNFAQIEVGDRVKATVTEQLVIFVRKPGTPSGDKSAATVAPAPLGTKPGAVDADTVEVTAKVKSIDVKHHKATLEFPDGTNKTFKVRKDVDLTQQNVGAEVVIRSSDVLAISLEKR